MAAKKEAIEKSMKEQLQDFPEVDEEAAVQTAADQNSTNSDTAAAAPLSGTTPGASGAGDNSTQPSLPLASSNNPGASGTADNSTQPSISQPHPP